MATSLAMCLICNLCLLSNIGGDLSFMECSDSLCHEERRCREADAGGANMTYFPFPYRNRRITLLVALEVASQRSSLT